ncbi:unnamed protein product [Nezara viridula]|uniref:Uncharacterized protein n=1 Tax=Nezara viridula TaxID=85310 RepID=A0A9P0E3F0_NEZVI|nr:unnamed protein product [Nezara viridula]
MAWLGYVRKLKNQHESVERGGGAVNVSDSRGPWPAGLRLSGSTNLNPKPYIKLGRFSSLALIGLFQRESPRGGKILQGKKIVTLLQAIKYRCSAKIGSIFRRQERKKVLTWNIVPMRHIPQAHHRRIFLHIEEELGATPGFLSLSLAHLHVH